MSSQPNSVKSVVDSINQTLSPRPYPPVPQHKMIISCVLAYLIPGAGHVYLGKWQRGLAFFASIYAMFILGIALHGHLYGFSVDPGAGKLSLLLTFANAGNGLAYYILYALHSFAGISIGFGQPQAEAWSYEYANTFLWTSGLLNFLVTMDIYDIADGRKK